MSYPAIMRIMSHSLKTAAKAGTIIRDIMHEGSLGIIEKGKNDPQTEADRSAQRSIIASISKMFPKAIAIGEEGNIDMNIVDDMLVTELDEEFLKSNKCPESLINIKEEDVVIWVDPLDGTSEYTQGYLDHVTVLIGIAVENSAVGGIIHQPYYRHESGELGRSIWGLKGLGTGGFIPKEPPQGKFIITTTRTHSSKHIEETLNALDPTEVFRVGGAGYKVIQLLEGKAHAYVFPSAGGQKWDTCAPEAILETYGGVLTDVFGKHYEYNASAPFPNRRGIIATVKSISHQALIDKIPISVKNFINEKQ